ncbi:methionyl-tRNA synthetase [Elasticomyces elasticus]|nr:methionyl-tRNA synthetase [Elasticomyces elasticus]
MVLTDVLKRWQVLRGRRAILCTGTDEHGMKVQRASAEAGSEPKQFCDKGAEVFKTLASRVQLSNDHFVRTTDAEHREAVEYAWAKHEGWYSVSDETFYPESAVHLKLDPPTGRKIMVSTETGKEVEWTSEMNYHFRLSAFRERLLEFYKDNPTWIVPASRMNDVVSAVSSSLSDLSISRPVERLTWGIRVPSDSSQTIYVWLDALLNYITKAGYPWAPNAAHDGGWPADVQVIGKDIVRFHCIYWPAFLMALDLPLPKRILTHAHWTLGKQKMAKSTGNVVNPFFALDRFGVDTMRYYLAHDGGITDDADYENKFIIERYKKGLQGGLGNLASRIMRGKDWNVQKAVERFAPILNPSGEEVTAGAEQEPMLAVGRLDDPLDKEAHKFHARLQQLPPQVETHFDNLMPNLALKQIMLTIYAANAYLQATSPWTLVSWLKDNQLDPPPNTKEHIDRIVFLCAESLRICGILLQPYMPDKAKLLLDMIGVDEGRRTWADARVGADATFGVPMVDLGAGSKGVLFPVLGSDT